MGSMGYKVTGNEYARPFISERAIDQPRPLKVIYIGAGISGICAAIQFPKFVRNLELAIYEKNPDIGVRGSRIDVPAHSYQLSYKSDVDRSKFYVGAAELLDYWRRVVRKYDIRTLMKSDHKCIEARCNELTCKWHVKFEILGTGDIIEDIGDVLVMRDLCYDPTGQKIAVIGAGSSGIQVVPALQPKVKAMDHYIRGRTWIAASFGNELVRQRNDGRDGNFDYTPQEIKWRENDPESYVRYRKTLEVGMQGSSAMTHRWTPTQDAAWATLTTGMRKSLQKKSEIAEHLIPEFPPLQRRLTPGLGYLATSLTT
ncbi:hypothetical protein LTR93_011746 [Exophiala xenobiotica]|nr:hypothetical protein LTR93_011746 [Exophiala xenobiotica]